MVPVFPITSPHGKSTDTKDVENGQYGHKKSTDTTDMERSTDTTEVENSQHGHEKSTDMESLRTWKVYGHQNQLLQENTVHL